jgi:hypothetical protein
MDGSGKNSFRHAVALFETPKGVMEMCDSEPFDRKVSLKKVHDENRSFRPIVLIYKGNCGT